LVRGISLRLLYVSLIALCVVPAVVLGQSVEKDVCPRPRAGSIVPEPVDLGSENGVLKVQLTYTNFRDALGQMHYCYRDSNGSQAPNLRLHPGDWLVLTLKNELKAGEAPPHQHSAAPPSRVAECGSGAMGGLSTNLHFHGVKIAPVCHQDDVLHTLISPSDPPFEYRLQVPADQPPGVYWYHPHVHGASNLQVQGGASGALIVEGIERANPAVAGLPERILIIRDQPLLTPDAEPYAAVVMPEMPVLRDPDGDILNTGTGAGPPSKDLSINFVAVPYPDYPPGLIIVKPLERQLWRVLNASAITYLDLRLQYNGVPQFMGEVSIDGTPVNSPPALQAQGGKNRPDKNGMVWLNHIDLPPGGRADFIIQGPPLGVYGNLITQAVDTGPAGENDPVRPLANIMANVDAREPRSTLPPSGPLPVAAQNSTWLGNAKPVRVRKLYFSERPSDPNNPNSSTVFMLTVDGQEPAPYDPRSTAPNMTVKQGEVEDWIIENRTQELHAFHIHQLHFMLEESNGVHVDEPFLRDTVNVGFWDGKSASYPSVKLRMDFRSPRLVGTFVYHCHLLEHEDGGMMGTIHVVTGNEGAAGR
jgi:FtsP/CotA-like multicopper oxidase with cupredoxin domain